MGTHFTFIFRGYNIYNPDFWGYKTIIFNGFWGPKVGEHKSQQHIWPTRVFQIPAEVIAFCHGLWNIPHITG